MGKIYLFELFLSYFFFFFAAAAVNQTNGYAHIIAFFRDTRFTDMPHSHLYNPKLNPSSDGKLFQSQILTRTRRVPNTVPI